MTLVLHELVADLDIDVTSPAGTTVTLTTDNGGTNSNTFDGTFWDDGVGFLNPPGPVSDNPLIGTQLILVPEEAMGAFIGEDPNGTWTITVTDDTAQNTGTLLDWGLDLTTLPAPPIFAAPVSVTSTDTPLPITDLATTASTIAFAGAGAFVCDVDLTTDITHTSADDLELVRPDALAGSLRAYLAVLAVLEGDRRYRNLQPYGEPQLGRRGLYRSLGGDDRDAARLRELALLWVLNQSDGEHGLLEIAERSGLPMARLEQAAGALVEAGLVGLGS